MISPQHRLIDEGVDESRVSYDNDSISSASQESGISEQDIHDALFEAGYTLDEINAVFTAKVEAATDPTNLDSNMVIDRNVAADTSTPSEPLSLNTTASIDVSPVDVLREIRVKNVNKVIIGTLNINSLAPKFEELKAVIGKNIDILTIQETKLDDSFPPGQFTIDGYSEPYRLDRNKHGGGVMIYIREDIPSKLLNKHSFSETIEGLFIEINLCKTKLLLFGSHRSDHTEF